MMDHTSRTLWLARDYDGALYLYGDKPKRHYPTNVFWYGEPYIMLPRENYPEVTYENSPVRVESMNIVIECKFNNNFTKMTTK